MMASPAELGESISLDNGGFDEWASCVRRLLGWAEGIGADWAALFASGHTPRDAARATVYGDTNGD